MGNFDRIIRLILAAFLVYLYASGMVSGTFGAILLVIASIFILTSLIRFCPLYTLVGLSTCSVKNPN